MRTLLAIAITLLLAVVVRAEQPPTAGQLVSQLNAINKQIEKLEQQKLMLQGAYKYALIAEKQKKSEVNECSNETHNTTDR